MLAQKLRRATEETQHAATRGFLSHWEGKKGSTFGSRRRKILLLLYAEHGGPHHPASIWMLEGHIRIRRDADILARQPSLSLVHQLGTQLAEHVQLQEQQVLPLIEQTIPAHDLATLSQRLKTPRPR